MPRPKKTPALPAPDLGAVNQILAKARAIVATSGKRKDSSEALESAEAPPATKPKGGGCVTKAAPVSPPFKSPPSLPPPPPTAVPAVPSEVESADSTKSMSPSERTQQYLKHVKAQRLAAKSAAVANGDAMDTKDDDAAVPKADVAVKCGAVATKAPPVAGAGDVPKATGAPPKAESIVAAAPSPVPTEIITPPPKVPAVKSPPLSPPKMKPLPYVSNHDDNDDRWNYGHSQKEYYASKGQSWWRDGWDYQGDNWFYDHYQRKYVVCHGDQAWAYDDWNHQVEEVPSPSLGGSPTAATPASEGPATSEVVHARLAARQPTFPSPHEEAEPTPNMETPNTETPNVEGAGGREGEGEDHQEPSGGDENPDAWRCDKNGAQLQPQALYMRFYRRIRSTLPENKNTLCCFSPLSACPASEVQRKTFNRS